MRSILISLLLSGLVWAQSQPRGKGTINRPWRDNAELRVPGEGRQASMGAKYTGPSILGKSYLKNRRYLKAAQVFRKQLEEDPEAKGVQVLLGFALAGAGKCAEARSLTLPNRDARAFDDGAAQALASCFAGEGDYEEALFWMEEALLFTPDSWSSWNQYAIYLFRSEDYEGSREAFDAAESLAPDEPGLFLSQAMLALSLGDIENVNEMLWMYDQTTFQPTMTRLQIEAQLEMDLGNPVRAERRLALALSMRPFFEPCIVLRVEAIRRLGYPESASTLLEIRESRLDLESSVKTRAVVSRLAVDLGDLDRARAFNEADLAEHPLDPEVLAAAWYLARAEGRSADAEALAARYERVRPAALRFLDELIPAASFGE